MKLIRSRHSTVAHSLSILISADGLEAEIKGRRTGKDSVAACLIVKDQPTELLEWIEYHHKLGTSQDTRCKTYGTQMSGDMLAPTTALYLMPAGIQTFYINDDNSDPPLFDALVEEIASGIVHYRFWIDDEASEHKSQTSIYDHCLILYGRLHRWMAFIDTDEVSCNGPHHFPFR